MSETYEVTLWNVGGEHKHDYQNCVAWLEKQYHEIKWEEIAANTYDAGFEEPWARELITTMFKNPLAKMSILDEEDNFVLMSFYLDDPLNEYKYSAQRQWDRADPLYPLELVRTSSLWRHNR